MELISERRAHSSSTDIELKSLRFIVLTLLGFTTIDSKRPDRQEEYRVKRAFDCRGRVLHCPLNSGFFNAALWANLSFPAGVSMTLVGLTCHFAYTETF
jgi:hypothetical protein